MYNGGLNYNEEREGKGRCSWENGESYDGFWRNGKKNGPGV